MRGLITKELRRQAIVAGKIDRKKYQALKRQHTLEKRYGGPEGLRKAYAAWGAKADQSKGGKASPANFKNNKELASHAGSKSKRIRQ